MWICMELMGTCLEKLMKRLKEPIPECILGKVAVAVRKFASFFSVGHFIDFLIFCRSARVL